MIRHQHGGAVLPGLKLPQKRFAQPPGGYTRLKELQRRLGPQISKFEALVCESLGGCDRVRRKAGPT